MTDTVETRRVQFSEFEIRSTTGDDSDYMSFRGYAAVFNSPTLIGDMWVEVIERGAFTEALAGGDDVLALIEKRKAG